MAIGQELLNVPMGDMIREMALAIAEAQVNLDEASMRVAEMMSGTVVETDDDGTTETDTRVYFGSETVEGEAVPVKASMMELGFTPTFYQFVDTIIEVKIAIKITRESEYTRTTKGEKKTVSLSKSGLKISTTPVDATYSSSYSYSAEGSSLIRTKLVPVPPPSILEERIRHQIEAAQSATEEEIK